jgi:hypothetical protein
MNRIKENLLLPIVLQVTQVPLGSYGWTDGQGADYMLPRNFSGSIKTSELRTVHNDYSLSDGHFPITQK